MSCFYEIQSINDPLYHQFEKIYVLSFPVFEQRNREQQQLAFKSELYHLCCIVEDNILNSFVAYWEFPEYIYIEHLAVNNDLKGRNIGTTTLQLLKKEVNKIIILEIDPIVDDISAKRLHFYEKLDFRINPYQHFHPSYNNNYPPHELVVLSTEKILDQELYFQFKSDLESVIMKFE